MHGFRVTLIGLFWLSVSVVCEAEDKDSDNLLTEIVDSYETVAMAELREGKLVLVLLLSGNEKVVRSRIEDLNKGSYPKLLRSTKTEACLILNTGTDLRAEIIGRSKLCPIKNGKLLYNRTRYSWERELKIYRERKKHRKKGARTN